MARGALGERGSSWGEVQGLLSQMKAEKRNIPWYGSRKFRPSYFAGDDVVKVSREALNVFLMENWLYGRTSFPALGELEDDVLASLQQLFHAPEGAGGILTSGGTESLILSVKIPRDRARKSGRQSEPLNIVLPWSAHPAFDKAADLLRLDARRAPASARLTADVEWIRQACDDKTILIVGSAPPYPFGQVDPIEALSEIALERDLWLHVDACLGGMILPFAADAGGSAPPFDFRVPGVRSMSVDLHKYGYACKGVSALMLREAADAVHGGTTFSNWAAGVYRTPGLSGTRSGGPLASAWAVMRYLGRDGFVDRTRKILGIRSEFFRSLEEIGATVVGHPECYHFAFAVEGVDGLLLADELTKEGWIVVGMELPSSVQVMVNASHDGIAPRFSEAVGIIASEIRAGTRKGTGQGAVYSM
jgi:sphinganine-1-phosphate aldolase